MATNPCLVTAEQLEKFPDDDHRYELVDGRLLTMSPPAYEHGRVVMRVMLVLGSYVSERKLGDLLPEVGYKLASNPDTVRGPDLSFIRHDRLPFIRKRGFVHGAPDFVVEVLSPDDRPGEMRRKLDDYLTHGVQCVLVLDPDDETATLYRRLGAPVTLRGDDRIDLSDVIAGFTCQVQHFFE